jgi:hypothetical protein
VADEQNSVKKPIHEAGKLIGLMHFWDSLVAKPSQTKPYAGVTIRKFVELI